MSHDAKRYQSFPLRLSPSTRQQASELAVSEGISLNHFISLAVAEKVARMEQASLMGKPARPKETSFAPSAITPSAPRKFT
jgi:hypothetical protein